MPNRRSTSGFALLNACVWLCAGCVEDKRIIDTESVSNAISLADVCSADSTCRYLSGRIDDVDLLFVIDNSNSMIEEQLRMPAQFHRLVDALTTGDHDGDGTPDFPRARSVHLGVVSSDMGLPSVEGVDKCERLGDDGRLLHAPSTRIADCAASYPPFITAKPGDADAAAAAADDFSCMATLGTEGCGFEQQLEAGLKALWPAVDPMPKKNGQNRIRFLTDFDGSGEFGHGDSDNAGFLRNDPLHASIVGVIVLSDEDDGSSPDMQHFVPEQYLDPADPLADQPLNLRNFYNNDKLYPVKRYVDGWKALRPEAPERVVFGAIVGVPPELTSADKAAAITESTDARDAFYAELLAAPSMQERVDKATLIPPHQGNVRTSCMTLDADDEATGKAYPPRRIVQVARGFGENGFVQSICDDQFDLAIDTLVERVGARLDSNCLDTAQGPDRDGTLDECKVLWVLPPAGEGGESVLDCADAGDFLKAVGTARGLPDHLAGRVCQVPQTSAKGEAGWYYDDSSADAALCLRSHARISFTDGAEPPDGTRVILDCK